MLAKINDINKFGVKHRIILQDTQVFSFLLVSIKYQPAKQFYVVDTDGIMLGIISAELLAAVESARLRENPTIEAVLSMVAPRDVYQYDDSLSELGNVDAMASIFNENIKIQLNGDTPQVNLELPVIDSQGKLVAIVDLIKLKAMYDPPKHKTNEPIIQWSPAKTFPAYNKNLNAFGSNVNTCHGEDGIIERIFELIGTTNKYAIEFGGWDGVVGSNTRNLLTNHGWSGLFIEGNEERSAQCKINYKDNDKVTSVVGFVGFLKNKKLDVYLKENNAPQSPDLLSIDIDGYDYHVWESLVEHDPRVIIIEYNITVPKDVYYINAYTEEVMDGSSAAALVALAHKKGYELAAVTMANCIFVKSEDYEKLGIVDNSLDALWVDNLWSSGKCFYAYSDKKLIPVNQYPVYWWG